MKNFLGSFSLPEVVYHRPAEIPEAIALLRENTGCCLVIAGCTDVIPMIRRGKLEIRPQTHIVDLSGIETLVKISVQGETMEVGAAAPYSSIIHSTLISDACPLLACVVSDIGSVQIRNSGTIGGNLCTASPGGDASVGLLALDAEVRIAGADGEKSVPLSDFFTGYGKTVLGPEEIVTAVRFSKMTPEDRSCWLKHGRRSAFTMSVLSVAVKFRIVNGLFEGVKLAMGLAGPAPLRIFPVEQFLQQREATPETIFEAASMASETVQPRSSFRASADYRKDMTGILVRRALTHGLNERRPSPEWPASETL